MSEGEIITGPGTVWPLMLMWYGGAGLAGLCGMAVLKVGDSLKEEDSSEMIEGAEEKAMLVDHHGSEPGERDAAVVILFLFLAAFFGGVMTIETLLAVVPTFACAFQLGHSQGTREATSTASQPIARPVAPVSRPKNPSKASRPGVVSCKRSGLRSRPGGMRRVRSAGHLSMCV